MMCKWVDTRLPKAAKGRKRAEASPHHRRLKGALVLLTNAPASRLSAPQARTRLRVRWQIELIWKWWNQDGKVDGWRSEKGMPILCEVYAKLMAMIMQHGFPGCALHHLDDEWAFDTPSTLSHHVSRSERMSSQPWQETPSSLTAPVRGFWLSS